MDVDHVSPPREPSSSSGARKRISTACEACRATKIKCEPSEQPGVCRKYEELSSRARFVATD